MGEQQAVTKEESGSNLALMKRDVVDVVASRVREMAAAGQIQFPANYSPENAMKAAWLEIQDVQDKNKRPALEVCTPNSVANALLKMVIQGLTPAKQQVYFIVYGNKLVCQRSYFGSMAVLKRIYPEARAFPELVYQGDKLSYRIVRGRKEITGHDQNLGNINDDKITHVYVVLELGEGHEPHTEIMTIDQVKAAWKQGQTKGTSPAHKGFPGEMAKKSAINRACKLLINESDDSYLVHAAREADAAIVEAEIDAEAAEFANIDLIDITDDPPAQIASGDGRAAPEETETETETEASAPDDAPLADSEAPEGSPSSPAARFMDLLDAHEMSPTKARQLAATTMNLDDARKLTNDHYAKILDDVDSFVALYFADQKDPAAVESPQEPVQAGLPG